MEILYAEDKKNILRKSSVDQHKHHLSVYGQGGWLPIEYDVLEYIGCEGHGTHRAILSLAPDDLGYDYPEACCVTHENEYLLADQNGVVQHYTDADNGSLGEHNDIGHLVGLDYYQAGETLEAA